MPIWFYAIILSLTINKQAKVPVYDYHSNIFADGAGYYAHLVNMWDADAIATLNISEEARNGNAFVINRNTELLETKYTMGTAMLLSPFYLIGKAYNYVFELEEPIFSKYYSTWICVGACFYFCLAFFFMQRTIMMYKHDWLVASLSPLLLLFVTNLMFYVTDKNCYSHLYSFFCLSAIIYFTQKAKYGRYALHINAAIIFAALAILCRPTNAIILLIIPFTGMNKANLKAHLLNFFKSIPKFVPGICIAAGLIFVQLDYWKAIGDSYLLYSYGEEGFTNWNKPPIFYFLFSTNNGWLTYSPFIIICLYALVKAILEKKPDSTLFLVVLLIGLYIQASWWCTNFGCSYGMRAMVDFYPLLSLPLGMFLFDVLYQKKGRQQYIFWTLTLLFLYINFDMLYYYDGCFYGGDWDWEAYRKLYVY
jgi:hypothetical protein